MKQTITKDSIEKDLAAMLSKFGIKFLIMLCATVLYEHQWYNWNEMKKELYEELENKFD